MIKPNMFEPKRIFRSIDVQNKYGLAGALGVVWFKLSEIKTPERKSEYVELLKLLNAICGNIQNCATTAYRISEMIYSWSDVNLVARFCELDATYFLTQARVIYDYAAEVVNLAFNLPGPAQGYYRTKFRSLKTYCANNEGIAELQTEAGRALLHLTQTNHSFDLIAGLRDKLVHENASACAYLGTESLYVTFVDREKKRLIPEHDVFPANIRCPQLKHFFDFRAFFAWLVAELTLFLDDLGLVLNLAYDLSDFHSIWEMSVAYNYERVLKDWLNQLSLCVNDSSVKPIYTRLQVANSMVPQILGSPLRFC